MLAFCFFRFQPLNWFKPLCLAEIGFCQQKPNPGSEQSCQNRMQHFTTTYVSFVHVWSRFVNFSNLVDALFTHIQSLTFFPLIFALNEQVYSMLRSFMCCVHCMHALGIVGESLLWPDALLATNLWPPYVIGQAIYIFILSFVLLCFFFSFLA